MAKGINPPDGGLNNEQAINPDDTNADPAMSAALAQTLQWPIRRFQKGIPTPLLDRIVREKRIELVLNDMPLLAMLALPSDVEDLALGFLLSEGVWRDRANLPTIEFDPHSGKVHCRGHFDEDAVEGIHRRWTFGTGCGGGGTARDPSILDRCRQVEGLTGVRASQLTDLNHEFNRRTALYRATGGVHACAIAEPTRLLLFAEDIGRHNAFDKVAGAAVRCGINTAQSIALTTGRVSAEIVGKVVAHGIPLLASSSAPTALGLQWAKRFGLTVVGFLRGERMNVYTAYERVIADA